MKIVLTIPILSIPHDGTRIIIEWANRLSIKHNVTLYCKREIIRPNWINISQQVRVTNNVNDIRGNDMLIICSPHSIHLKDVVGMPEKKIIFLQMLEHLFKPGDIGWFEKCNRTYGCDLPTIVTSEWNKRHINQHFPDKKENIYVVGNGINFNDFPIKKCKKDGKTVLIEGWESNNPSKDCYQLAPTVAQMLRDDGYTILAYSQKPIKIFPDTPNEYYYGNSKSWINRLYERASILIKATKYDSMSLSPLEAMTKGCVTVRAIAFGDEELIHNENCIRLPYSTEADLYREATNLLEDEELQETLRKNCYASIQKHSWNYWFPKIEEILFSV